MLTNFVTERVEELVGFGKVPIEIENSRFLGEERHGFCSICLYQKSGCKIMHV